MAAMIVVDTDVFVGSDPPRWLREYVGHFSRANRLLRADAIAVHDLAVEQVRDR
jgi:hypothetical protein